MVYFLKNIIIILLFVTLSSCIKEENTGGSGGNNIKSKSEDVLLNKESSTDTSNKSIDKQIDSQPDYVPPKNGGNNKKWYCNRNKILMKDSNCYFGRGLQKRHRYRHGWQNSE